MTRLLMLSLLLLCPSVLSGMWDRDRPTDDDLPGRADIITGRFDRLPDTYHDMRLARARAAIAELPSLHEDPDPGPHKDALPLFDDAAVALIKLGRFDEAVSLLDRKLSIAESVGDQDYAAGLRHRARGFSNKAACLLQRALGTGTRQDLENAAALLERVIEEDRHNLDAAWALTEIEWRLNAAYVRGGDPIFPNLLGLNDASFRGTREPVALDRNRVGGALGYLGRRVVHGMGWGDVDVMYAYSLALALAGFDQEAALAWLRVNELLDAGETTRVAGAPNANSLKRMMRVHLPELQAGGELQEVYRALRDNADQWVRSRNEYAARRLSEGRHPDTDPTFWAAWRLRDSGPAQPDQPDTDAEPLFSKMAVLGAIAALVGVFVLLFLATMLLGRNKSPHPTVDEL